MQPTFGRNANAIGAGALHLLVIVAAAASFGGLCLYHELQRPTGAPPPTLVPPPRPAEHFNAMFHVLLAMATVLFVGRCLGVLFRALRQPPVVAEIVAGILLGPSLLGWIAPQAYHYLLPAEIVPFLNVIAQLGVILYMFLVGLEFDADFLRGRASTTLVVSNGSIVGPFLVGALLSLPLYERFSTSETPFPLFCLFLGVATCVTAFPVLARILDDRGLAGTESGSLALACAALNDVVAWCLLALVVGVAQTSVQGALLTAALTAAYIALMLTTARPLTARLIQRFKGRPEAASHAPFVVFLVLLLSSLATEVIGIHAIFGAFLFGAIIPHKSEIARQLSQRLEDVVRILLLPSFFALTGMKTEISLVYGWENVLLCLLVIGGAAAGKIVGGAGAGRLAGLSWREAAVIGALMNTRGLMELIVLSVGLDLKVISPTLFTIFVLMAVTTTMATGPLLDLLHRGERASSQAPAPRDDSTAEAERRL